MTLPQATSLQIKSRTPSAAEILAYAASRRSKWFSPQSGAVKREEPIEPVVTRIYMTAPTERVWTAQHNSHMAAFYEWRLNQPLAFLKLRCREMGISYDDMVGPSRAKALIPHRHKLMAEIWARFGISLPKIGMMFGGRDNSTVTYALRKHGVNSVEHTVASRGDQIFALWRSGLKQAEIAKAVGYCQSSVQRYMARQPWFPKQPKKVWAKDCADEIKAMYAGGTSVREIAKQLGLHRDSVSQILRREGVTAPRLMIKDRASELRAMFKAGATQDEMGQATGFHPAAVGKFIRGKRWKR